MRTLFLTLTLLSLGLPCAAQDEEEVPDNAAPGEASGSEEGAAPEEEQVSPERAEALTRYRAATELAESGDYAAALAEFEEIYRLLDGYPTQANVLYNIGVCHQELFHYDRAIESFERYLEEAGEGAARAAEVQGSLRALAALLGTLEVEVDAPQAVVWLGDRELGAAPGVFRIPAGQHVIEVRAPDRQPERREIIIAARATERLELSLSELAAPYEGISPVFFATFLGVAAASAATGAVLGGLALSEVDLDRPITTADQDRALALSIPADVLFGLAGVLSITAVVLATLTDWGGDAAEAEGELSLFLGPTGGGAQWRARF